MKVRRTIKINTTHYKKGDIISFKLTDGEKVEAIAMRRVGDSMLFIHMDCLKRKYPMNLNNSNEGGYDASDLRKNLNGEILARFPDKIRKRMVAFDNGDMLSIPSQEEIFGVNKRGEADDVKQLKSMKKKRNRIAFQGNGTDEWAWYWLKNRAVASVSGFCGVNDDGYFSCDSASGVNGVRPLFMLRM